MNIYGKLQELNITLPPIATPADWVRDRMTVLSARGAVRLVSRPGRGPAALRWVACRSSGALLLGLGLSVQAGCTADTLTSAGVALLALSCAGLGALGVLIAGGPVVITVVLVGFELLVAGLQAEEPITIHIDSESIAGGKLGFAEAGLNIAVVGHVRAHEQRHAAFGFDS